MRQGGFKPKGHNSGTYWVRANANSGGGKTKQSTGDKKVSEFTHTIENMTSDRTTRIAKYVGVGMGLALSVFLIIVGAANG
jgi:hypothetical protein